jgi:glycosyltransferase involved in cell wall biosynthesis
LYPHDNNRISTPDAIGCQLGRRLQAHYEVIYHDYTELGVIVPELGDVLLGHPHPDPRSLFRRSLNQDGWQRRLMLAPFEHRDFRRISFEDSLIERCDLILAITGSYWFQTIEDSLCSHWRPKMRHLDLAVDRSDFPLLKTSFGALGKRRVVYIGHTAGYKNTPFLSEIAARLPDMDFAWIGTGTRPIPGLANLGFVDFASPVGKDLVAGFDFLLTVGDADANPTTILEAMSWGLIPICTPTSGYQDIPSIPNVPVDDAEAAAAVVRRLLSADESDLLAMQSANRKLLDDYFTWDRFADQVVDAIESSESPPLGRRSLKRRLLITYYDVTSPYGRVRFSRPGRVVSRWIGRWQNARATRAAAKRGQAPHDVMKYDVPNRSIETEPLAAVIFSKDRPLQLEATLASLFLRCADSERVAVSVLYKTSSARQERLYQQLRLDYPVVAFRRERRFRDDLLALLAQAEFVAFVVDDALFIRDFSFQTAIEELRSEDLAIGFSLRLGTNTVYCYPLDAQQDLPEFTLRRPGVLAYRWPGASHDFGYPFDLSSSVYRTADIAPLLRRLRFENPNTLEARLAAAAPSLATERPLLLCLERSAAFCIPANRVQSVLRNRAADNPDETPNALAAAFERGDRIDVARYYDFPNAACHQEVPLWLSRPDPQPRATDRAVDPHIESAGPARVRAWLRRKRA